MRLRQPPSWLLADRLACTGLMTSTQIFFERLAAIERRKLARCPIRLAELGTLARLLAAAEAWLEWTIAARALRLAGLPARAVFPQHVPLRSYAHLRARVRSLIHRSENLDGVTQRHAHRLRRLAAQKPATATATTLSLHAAPARATTTTLTATGAATRAGLRVRAPPWPPPGPYARKSPLAPPDFASSLTPSIRIARSTAFSMS